MKSVSFSISNAIHPSLYLEFNFKFPKVIDLLYLILYHKKVLSVFTKLFCILITEGSSYDSE